MKKAILIDLVIVMVGAALTPWALIKWYELGFPIEPKFYAGNRDGSLLMIVAVIGVALIAYGIFNIYVLRRK